MLNLRQIDYKFYLSGGWQNVPKDLDELKYLGIKAILDLQFIPWETMYDKNDTLSSIKFITDEAKEEDIHYEAILMRDDEHNVYLPDLLLQGYEFIASMEKVFSKRKDKILIKCGAGISRSPAMLINYLCIKNRWSYVEALNYIREKEEYQVQFGTS